MDWSTGVPDLCWFFVCEYLSISDIAQLSSTCQTLRHLLWSYETSLWSYLIHVKCRRRSSAFSQSILTLFDQDQGDDAVSIENDRFVERLSCEASTYQLAFAQFVTTISHRPRFDTWYNLFTSAWTTMRGFLAYKRCLYLGSMPLLTSHVPLSATLFRVYYHRLHKTTTTAAIGAVVYAYLIDRRRHVAVRDMLWEGDRILEHERVPVVAEEDGSVCITACCPSPVSTRLTCLYPKSTPTWADLLPGRYNLTCRIRIRRQSVDHDPNALRRIGYNLLYVDLLGDRVRPRGILAAFKRPCPWFEQEHSKHGDDTWFCADLINDFVLYDISNVYLGIRVDENSPVFFAIWIDTFQLNFIGIN